MHLIHPSIPVAHTSRICLLLQRMRREQQGLALLEFAFTLPIFMGMFMGGVDLVNYAIASMRVSEIGMMTADNAARVLTKMYESDVNEIFTGAALAGDKIHFATQGRIVLTGLEMNTKKGQYLRWQRCFGAKVWPSSYGLQGDGLNKSTVTGMGPVGKQIAAEDGVPVMFVEVVYDFKPLFLKTLWGTQQIKFVTALNDRDRVDNVLYNTTNPAATVATC